jgi:hypothetical protein
MSQTISAESIATGGPIPVGYSRPSYVQRASHVS